MTGAGLAGCAVALVEEGQAGDFMGVTERAYRAASGLQAAVHLSRPGSGAELRRISSRAEGLMRRRCCHLAAAPRSVRRNGARTVLPGRLEGDPGGDARSPRTMSPTPA